MAQYLTLKTTSQPVNTESSCLNVMIPKYLNLNVISASNDRPIRKRLGKYTLAIFLERAQAIHGDKYDYSAISETDIINTSSEIIIRCKTCDYIWSSKISNHIYNKSGCKSCVGLLPITFEVFSQRIRDTYEDSYEFPGLTPKMIRNNRSKINVLCKICGYKWITSVSNLIYGKKKCLQCVNNLPWTPERFLIRAKEIHGDKFDYSDASISQIRHKECQIEVRCRACGYIFHPTVHNHINGRSGCRQCCGLLKWTLEQFIVRAKEIHGDRYDYRLITEAHIENQKSKVPVICNCCSRTWHPKIDDHINAQSGCRHCNTSKGEIACEKYLQSAGIQFWDQYIIPNLDRKRFDFMFMIGDRRFLLEFDGEPHFKFTPRFHETMEYFKERQQIDIMKTQKGIEAGYFVIRIDYSQIHNIGFHIMEALSYSPSAKYYVSNEKLYHYLIAPMNTYLIRTLI